MLLTENAFTWANLQSKFLCEYFPIMPKSNRYFFLSGFLNSQIHSKSQLKISPWILKKRPYVFCAGKSTALPILQTYGFRWNESEKPVILSEIVFGPNGIKRNQPCYLYIFLSIKYVVFFFSPFWIEFDRIGPINWPKMKNVIDSNWVPQALWHLSISNMQRGFINSTHTKLARNCAVNRFNKICRVFFVRHKPCHWILL